MNGLKAVSKIKMNCLQVQVGLWTRPQFGVSDQCSQYLTHQDGFVIAPCDVIVLQVGFVIDFRIEFY